MGPWAFRTASLWGLGQRRFFLHDGRTADLRRAIQAHRSGSRFAFNASEADGTVKAHDRLDDATKQNLLKFMRSLLEPHQVAESSRP